MSFFPSAIGRVPNAMSSRLQLSNINRTNIDLLHIQEQLSTSKTINRLSDDPVKAAAIMSIQDRLSQSTQRKRNLTNATSALNQLDTALADTSTLARQAKDIAATQVNSLSTASDRAAQASVVQSIINGLYGIANRTGVSGYMFGASQPGTAPVANFRGAYRFVDGGQGLLTDQSEAGNVPITMGANNAIGATSTRVKGAVDVNPSLTADTKLSDLHGARGVGITLGTIQMSINGGTRVDIDLNGCDTVGDVAARINKAVRDQEASSGNTYLAPPGITTNTNQFEVYASGGTNIQFFDVGNGTTSQDLGLTTTALSKFTNVNVQGQDLDPKLTWRTPISAMAGVTGALGKIRINNAGATAVVDLSGATTLEDIKNAIEGADMGVRVQINDTGTGIDVVDEVSGGKKQAMSIEEVPGENYTASRLGIRSFASTTLISDLNDGRGVSIIDGKTDPITGLPSPALNTDFTVKLGDAAGTTLSIDLKPQDMQTVQTVLNAINTQMQSQLTSAGLQATDAFATLDDVTNGIVIQQNATFSSGVTVAATNNSTAAVDLGLTTGSYDASTHSLRGSDTGKVRVNNLFTQLIDLRDSLTGNDVSGITLAGQGIDASIDSVSQSRGLAGGYAQRVDTNNKLEQEQNTVDTEIQSQLQDTDFASAAVRLSQLQQQLTASYQTTATLMKQTLMDFLR